MALMARLVGAAHSIECGGVQGLDVSGGAGDVQGDGDGSGDEGPRTANRLHRGAEARRRMGVDDDDNSDSEWSSDEEGVKMQM